MENSQQEWTSLEKAFVKIKEYQQMFDELPSEKRNAMNHQEIANYLDIDEKIVKLLIRGGYIHQG